MADPGQQIVFPHLEMISDSGLESGAGNKRARECATPIMRGRSSQQAIALNFNAKRGVAHSFRASPLSWVAPGVVVFLLCSTLGACQSTPSATKAAPSEPVSEQPTEPDAPYSAEGWPDFCREAKVDLAEREAASVVLQPQPQHLLEANYWPLMWHNIRIPLPPIVYTDVILSRVDQGKAVVLKLAGEGVRVGATLTPQVAAETNGGEIIRQSPLFADISIPEAEATQLAEELSAEESLNALMLQYVGFHKTPSDLSCEPEKREQEMVLALALANKSTGSAQLLSAYPPRDPARTGWLARWREGGQDVWQYLIEGQQNAGGIWEVSLSVPMDSSFNDFGFLIDTDLSKPARKQPAWLKPLNKALRTNSTKDWKQVQRAFKKAKLSEKSMQAFEAFMQTENAAPSTPNPEP